MQNLSRIVIAQAYAEPVFELAIEADSLETVRSEIAALTKLFLSDSTILDFIDSPFIRPQDRFGVIQRFLKDNISDISIGFLQVLIKNARSRYIKDIHQCFEILYDKHSGITRINVTIAKELSDDKRTRMHKKFEEAVNGSVKLEILINPRIIGGIIIEHDDVVIDNSVARKLQDFSDQLKMAI